MNEDAKYWFDKGNEAYDSGDFEEAIKCYKKATELNPEDAGAFNNWGNALGGLARIKKDELLFREAIEKYKKATELNPENADTFYNWGNALGDLAEINREESLYREAIEKYEEVTRLNPEDADTLNNWGNALYDLAEINGEESLYKEAFEQFDKVAKINLDAFISCGVVLAILAKKEEDEEKKKLLFIESTDCFKKSGKDILDILVHIDKDDIEFITPDKTLYPLLDMNDTGDGRFFKETTNGIQEEDLNEYKKAYIRSIMIIRNLHVNNEYKEKTVAHYQKKTISQKMLLGSSKFRLNAINYSNDPEEGKVLIEHLFKEKKTDEKKKHINSAETEYRAFAGCFIFNHDSLNQFRLYGKEGDKEGTGLSLVFEERFFSSEAQMAMKEPKTKDSGFEYNEEEKYALFRCIYIDPDTGQVVTVGQKEEHLFYKGIPIKDMAVKETNIRTKISRYRDYIEDITGKVRENMKELKKIVVDNDLKPNVIEKLLINLRYLTKHVAFKEEQECRIVKIFHLIKNHGIIKSDDHKMYVEYEPDVSKHIK